MISLRRGRILHSLYKESSVCAALLVSYLQKCLFEVFIKTLLPLTFKQPRKNTALLSPVFLDDAEQHQYEEWLLHTQQLLQMQLKFLEEQIGVHRKSRKALCAKQRTAKKAGREFAEADAEKLKLVTEEQSKIQKQLDQVWRN